MEIFGTEFLAKKDSQKDKRKEIQQKIKAAYSHAPRFDAIDNFNKSNGSNPAQLDAVNKANQTHGSSAARFEGVDPTEKQEFTNTPPPRYALVSDPKDYQMLLEEAYKKLPASQQERALLVQKGIEHEFEHATPLANDPDVNVQYGVTFVRFGTWYHGQIGVQPLIYITGRFNALSYLESTQGPKDSLSLGDKAEITALNKLLQHSSPSTLPSSEPIRAIP